MGTVTKVFISAAAGTFLAEIVEPKLQGVLKLEGEFAVKGLKAVTAGGSAAAVYWALGKIG